MRSKVKIFVFLLVLAIALNINISNQYIQLGIPHVEAEQPWETLVTVINKPGGGSSYSPPFKFQPNKYKYRVITGSFSCNICNEIYIGLYEVDEVSGQVGSYITEIGAFKGGSRIYDINSKLNQDLTENKTYVAYSDGGRSKSTCTCGGTTVTLLGGIMYIQVQQINSTPSLNLTQPSPNSPLQGRHAYVKGVV